MHPQVPTARSPAQWYAAGLFAVYAAVLFGHAAAPSMTDYANWTYQGVLLARHFQGFADASHALKSYPVPNSAATVGIGLLALFLPWIMAAKVWLCVQMALSFLALRHLALTVKAEAAVWFIVPQAVFLGVNWWYGFVNFQLGCAWVLLTASLLLCDIRRPSASNWVIGCVLVIAFFTHMIPFAFCCLLVTVYAAQTRRWRVLWQLAPAFLLSAWYLAGRYLVSSDADGQAGMVAAVKTYSGAFWAYKGNSFLKSFGFVNPEGSNLLGFFGRPGFLFFFAVNLALAIFLGCWMIKAAARALRSKSDDRFLWLAIAALVPLYLLAPGTALGVSDPGSRLLQTGLALALVLCCSQRGWPLNLAKYCSGTLALAAIILFARYASGPAVVLENPSPLPMQVALFAHVPNHDQDAFYEALEHGNYQLQVFPTGMFLNRHEPRPAAAQPTP